MTRILANDGVTVGCKEALEDAGFEVSLDNVPQDKLNEALKNFDVLLVRSATKVRKETIDACPNLKMILTNWILTPNLIGISRSMGGLGKRLLRRRKAKHGNPQHVCSEQSVIGL